MNTFHGIWLTLALLMLALPAFAAEKGVYGEATVARFKKAPVIDGKISPGEWDGAVRTVGFQKLQINGGDLESRTGASYFGFTNDRLYIAVISEYPPDGKDHSSDTVRDKDYVYDESIEIWLDPNRVNRKSDTGDLRFYQMNANARGGIYDIVFDPKTGPSTGWNGNWDYANTVDHETHTWIAELSLPFADIGWKDGSPVGKSIGVLISRNYKGPWEQATWFPVLGAYIDWYRYAVMTLTEDAPAVQVTGLGENIHKGDVQLRAGIVNPGPARKAKVSLLITSSDMPELKDEKVLDLPANGAVPYSLDALNGRFHEDAQHQMTLDVTSPDSKETYLHYVLKWKKAPQKKWHYRIGPNPDAAVQFAYYPSYKFVRVYIDPRELGKEFDAVREAKVTITGPEEKTVLDTIMTWKEQTGLQEFQVGDLPDGDYTLTVTVPGWKDPFVRTFKRVHFPWEGNTLGITDEVLPPFTPITVKKNSLSVVGRTYTMDGLGLWRQVNSLGRDLLAAPMALVVDGSTTLKGKGKFTKTKPNMATYEGKAANPAVTVTAKTFTEVDGCMKVELTLAPGTKKEELASLWLDIPLKDKEAPLWHVSTTALRINPAGNAPQGEGEIWDSRQFPDGNWYGNFKCYLWLGAEERGLCWFADNDEGWVLNVNDKNPDHSAPCQQLIRKDGVLTLRVNLVQKPITLTEPRTIVFGVMASPGKPMPEDWRKRGITVASQFNMGYANPATYSAKYPWGNDWRMGDWAYSKRIGKGGPSKEELEDWKERNFPKDMDPKFREDMINLALGPFLGNFRPGTKYFKMYFDEYHSTAQAHLESKVFQSEWTGRWHTRLLDHPTVRDHKGWSINTGGLVDSYQDFACYYAAEWVKRGVGCYFDNAFPKRAYDTLTTTAYRMDNGRIQPSAGMWAHREYMKRIWTIHRTMAPPEPDAQPAMMIHMTNTHIIPYMVWNDENLDLEWKFGPEPQQSKYSHDFMRTETTGLQSGNAPFVLALVQDTKTKEQAAIAERTRFGAMMVHEVRFPIPGPGRSGLFKLLADFGYGEDDCQVFNYWQEDYPVKASDPEAKSLLLKRGKELLLLVCTWNPKDAEVVLTIDKNRLGVAPASAVNEEKPDQAYAYDAATGNLAVDLEGYGVRIIRVK